MAGRLAFEPTSMRARPSTGHSPPMKSFRPEFESVILNRRSDNLDTGKLNAISAIVSEAYSEAGRKGAGEKMRQVFRDFATRIDNNIVKLASQRLRDVAAGVRAEHLQEFLDVMHREMLANQDRADSIPEAMLSVYKMSGGRLEAGAIAKAVRIGFSKSRSLCPKEVSAVVKSEYESGALDNIREIAQLRHGQAGAADVSFPLIADPAIAPLAQNESPALLPEAVPIVHFLQPKRQEETSAGMEYSQRVPEIVALKAVEEVRQMRRWKRAARATARAPPAQAAREEIAAPQRRIIPPSVIQSAAPAIKIRPVSKPGSPEAAQERKIAARARKPEGTRIPQAWKSRPETAPATGEKAVAMDKAKEAPEKEPGSRKKEARARFTEARGKERKARMDRGRKAEKPARKMKGQKRPKSQTVAGGFAKEKRKSRESAPRKKKSPKRTQGPMTESLRRPKKERARMEKAAKKKAGQAEVLRTKTVPRRKRMEPVCVLRAPLKTKKKAGTQQKAPPAQKKKEQRKKAGPGERARQVSRPGAAGMKERARRQRAEEIIFKLVV